MRKVIFWVHLLAGLIAGSIILVMAATGVMISFDKQIIAFAEKSAYTVSPSGEKLQPAALLSRVQEAYPDARPGGLTLRKDPAAAAAVSLGRDHTVFVNPYTGAVLGEGSWIRGFLHDVEHFHRDLALGPNGKRITGACSIAFFGLIVTGIYLWFPRHWAKAILRPRFGLRGKARDFNWHNAFGFWAALPLSVMVLTGMIINYEWANRLLFTLAGSEPPPARKPGARGGRPGGGGQAPVDFAKLDAIWSSAEQKFPQWKTISVRAMDPSAPVNVMVDWGNGNRPDLRAMLGADLRSGEIVKVETYEANNMGRRLRMWVKPVHTGAAGGIVGQALAALSATAAIVLIWTGFALSWRRFRPKGSTQAPVQRPAPVAEEAVTAGS